MEDDPDMWILGDATGLFRGLVPALVSGAFAGMSIARDERRTQRGMLP